MMSKSLFQFVTVLTKIVLDDQLGKFCNDQPLCDSGGASVLKIIVSLGCHIMKIHMLLNYYCLFVEHF